MHVSCVKTGSCYLYCINRMGIRPGCSVGKGDNAWHGIGQLMGLRWLS